MNLLNFIVFVCKVLVLVSFVSGAVLKVKNNANPHLYRLDIIHYNDFHDRFEETSVPYPVCKTDDDQCLGGFPRLYQEVMTLLEEKPGALLLNAGDTFQGTYWYTLLKWNVTQRFINMLPNDAHAIGNHEFDDGIAGLAPYLAALKAPVLAANMDSSNEPSLNGLFVPHIVLERNGRKIGIIGLITPETRTSSNAEGVKFLDPIEVVEREAQLLSDQGVDIIIVLSHCGLGVDIDIAKRVGANIDVIVGGHSHSLLWNGTAPSGEHVSGPYPVLVQSSPGHQVLVVTAASMSKYLGNLTLEFDARGELRRWTGAPVFLNRSIPEDPKIKALLQPYKQQLSSLVTAVVGRATAALDMRPCGAGECALGDLVADSFHHAATQKYKSNYTTVVFLLRNMLRGSLPEGEITRGALINTLPFTNRVVTYVLRGDLLLEALERCLDSCWVKSPFNGPHMPQVAGMKLTLNTTSGKVVSALVREDDGFVPLDPRAEYQLVTPRFLLNEGNSFTSLKNGRDFKEVGTDTDIFEEYVKRISPISPATDGRLTVVS